MNKWKLGKSKNKYKIKKLLFSKNVLQQLILYINFNQICLKINNKSLNIFILVGDRSTIILLLVMLKFGLTRSSYYIQQQYV